MCGRGACVAGGACMVVGGAWGACVAGGHAWQGACVTGGHVCMVGVCVADTMRYGQ